MGRGGAGRETIEGKGVRLDTQASKQERAMAHGIG